MIRDWKDCVGRATYPAFETWPSEALLQSTKEAASAPEQIISADIISAYTQFLQQNGIDAKDMDADTIALLRRSLMRCEQVEVFIEALGKAWKSHWRQPPSLLHLKRMIKALPKGNGPQAQAKLLASYLKRWEIHAQSLSLAGRSVRVAA